MVAHDGDIGCDIILGYPWLRQRRIDVQPWRDALQLHDGARWVLRNRGGLDGSRSSGDEEEDDIEVARLRVQTTLEKEDDNEDFCKLIEKMQLTLVAEVDIITGDTHVEQIDDPASLEEAATHLEEAGNQLGRERRIRGVVLAEDEHPGAEAEMWRNRIVEEFDGTLFRERVWPQPPARGPHGLAELRLKPGAVPVVGRTIHLRGERLEAQKGLEEEWKRDQKIEPARGTWRAGAFPIKKKNGKWRGVCDYALTNKMIQPDSYPLPLTEEIVSEQAKCMLFSTVDLRDAFHQVTLDPKSRPITNIQLPGGLYQWTVVPQGINNGPPLLQREIDHTCKAVEDVARPYFDDILIGTCRRDGQSEEAFVEEHAQAVRRVFTQLVKDRWVADKAKARLMMRRVEFVGHVLGGGKRTPAPGKLAAVQRWTLPENVTALRGFLGLCNYYAGYVRMFAELAAPLQEKLKLPRELTKAGSKHKVEWAEEEKKAFEKLKLALVADLELHHINPNKPFALRTDASDYAIGAALEQFPMLSGVPTLEDIKPGASVAVGFMSRKLTEGQRRRWDTGTRRRMPW